MGLWCKDLPFVTVEQSRVPKDVTLVVPYYESPYFFAQQLSAWTRIAWQMALRVSFIVVDDGSPKHPAKVVVDSVGEVRPTLFKLFRIDQDVPWNWLAARNIGAHEARDGWLLLTDMDHVVPSETINSVVHGVHRIDTIYGFSRREHTGKPAQPHANSFLMTRKMYWEQFGGYDETLSGHYGTNGDAYRRMWKVAPMAILTDQLVRHEFVADSSTTQFKRKLPEDAAAVSKLVRARGHGWKPKTLSFAYHEVMAIEAVSA
jgi:hypothetical protein